MAKEPLTLPVNLSDAAAAMHDLVDRDGQAAADKLRKIFADAAADIANELARAAFRARTPLQQIAGGLLGQLGAMAVDKYFNKTGAPPPSSSGANHAPSGVTVNFHVGAGADGESIHRSAAQIAGHVARAVDYGNRNR